MTSKREKRENQKLDPSVRWDDELRDRAESKRAGAKQN
jgi:hypothetical protein